MPDDDKQIYMTLQCVANPQFALRLPNLMYWPSNEMTGICHIFMSHKTTNNKGPLHPRSGVLGAATTTKCVTTVLKILFSKMNFRFSQQTFRHFTHPHIPTQHDVQHFENLFGTHFLHTTKSHNSEWFAYFQQRNHPMELVHLGLTEIKLNNSSSCTCVYLHWLLLQMPNTHISTQAHKYTPARVIIMHNRIWRPFDLNQ